MSIKNITTIKLIFILLLFPAIIFPDNELKNKEKSIETIETEINQLEKNLTKKIEEQDKSEQRIDNLKLEIRKEKKERIKKERKKERTQINLVRSNYILDSLKKELKNTENNKNKTYTFINSIQDSINSIHHIIEFKQNELTQIKNKTELCIAVALPKNGFDQILKISCEIGIDGVQPLFSDRSIVKSVSSERITRWNLILKESVEQCERLFKPQLHDPIHLDDLIKRDLSKSSIALAGHTF